ncbi:alpha/beta hydrolase [Ralstonia pseudosolanacearum]
MNKRRQVLAYLSASALSGVMMGARAQPEVASRLLLVHGRAQQGKDPKQLKEEWVAALNRGAAKSGSSLPSIDVAFPFYGDLLDSYASQMDIPLTSEIQARGVKNDEFLRFQFEVADSIRAASGISEDKVNAEYQGDVRERGPLNWEWVQAILRAIDKSGTGMSQATLEIFTRDVFLYTRRAGVRAEIDRLVAKQLTEEPTVVVGHSLGSVVTYSVLRNDARALNVPLYVTVGCPLGIRAIRDEFRPLRFPDRVAAWFNAYDPRDVVALYPLDTTNFPVTPAIENKGDVDNQTDNRHGIVGYLDNKTVAQRIISKLVI